MSWFLAIHVRVALTCAKHTKAGVPDHSVTQCVLQCTSVHSVLLIDFIQKDSSHIYIFFFLLFH